jgi:dipeptidase D
MSEATMDHLDIRQLQPVALWNAFCDLNQIPRASKREERVTQFAADFGRSLGLETVVDKIGNVIIRKPATSGRENRTPVILQSHLDMVHQKNQATEFDFAVQGIQMEIRDDWVWAQGTTLGADNGIGVAAIMAILQSSDIPHPPLEALLTVDEETGMSGAKGLEAGQLSGKILLNLDTEEDNELTIGCAGGIDVTAEGNYEAESLAMGGSVLRLQIRGLKGGHSGMDIHLGRGNANKLIARLLWEASERFGIRLIQLDGGSLRNAIPREATAAFWVATDQVSACCDWIRQEGSVIKSEYVDTDPEFHFELESLQSEAARCEVLPSETQATLLSCLQACPNGVARMSPKMAGLVETSNNLARVKIDKGEWQVGCLTRSSIDSQRDALARSIRGLWEMAGGRVTLSGDYPGWQPMPSSTIVELMSSIYQARFGESPHVAACHGGLECGILGSKYPETQMISFGPNIRGAHSPEERVQISSVQKFWGFLLETLERLN